MDTNLFDSGFPMSIGDQEYTASTLTDRDYGDLNLYVQSAYIRVAVDASRGLSEIDKKEILSVAVRDTMGLRWNSEAGLRICNTTDGMLHIGFFMSRKRHKDLTFAKFKNEAIKDIESAEQQINIAYGRMHEMTVSDSEVSPEDTSKSE